MGKFSLHTRWLGLVWLLGAAALLAACQPPKAPSADLPDPTPTLAETREPTLAPTAALPSLPHAADDPLRFSFPTPGPEPVSLWRAPLQEVPWALNPNDHFFFVRPIAADVVNWPLADYRYGGVFFSTDIVHTGIDIPNLKGTPVLAAGPGKVVWAGYGLYLGGNDPSDPYGQAVTIQHNFGYQGKKLYTIYAHLDSIDAIIGQWVNTGDQIGRVGTTGLTTGPHLHFEVRIENNSYFATRNPELWLAPPQNCGVLVGRLMNTNGSLLTHQSVVITSLETRQKWTVNSYGKDTVISDDYYRENLVIGDLPAGDYQVSLRYREEDDPLLTEVTIRPGAVTYFTFRGQSGFSTSLPPTPSPSSWLKFTNP